MVVVVSYSVLALALALVRTLVLLRMMDFAGDVYGAAVAGSSHRMSAAGSSSPMLRRPLLPSFPPRCMCLDPGAGAAASAQLYPP